MPRDEQLLLMKNAQAVIQPSFFEGWSTVVEDAMALNVPVIASNIPVNIEQLQSKGIYFDPKSTIDLVDAIVNFGKRDFSKDNFGNYDDRIKHAALNFMSIVKGEKKKRVLQINTSVNFGSSGRIVEEIAALGNHYKFENYIAYGKGVPGKSDITYIKIGNTVSKIWHGLLTLLFDAHGRGSKLATKELISKIATIAPDILHIHNLHGYYLNYPLLFKYIKEKNLPVIWTLHDCWSFTGHCAHYENIGCQKWEIKCHACPKRNKYPKSIYYDGSEYNYLNKKELFSGVSSMQIITPSNWLNLQVAKSFLAPYSVQTINNGVDLELFKENIAASLSLRKQYKLEEKKIALCVAYNWSNAKGILDIVQVSNLLPDEFKFVIVGLSSNKIAELPKDIIAIEKTNNLNDLVNWYSLADVFVNPTYMDTFPTTNLESLACGTPVITYRSGGSPEAINQDTGLVLEKGDVNGMSTAIQLIASKGKQQYKEVCRKHAETYFNKNIQFEKYINLYNQLVNNN
jgi:glycosyltransferase involved in cell wall biosynthesis